MFTGIIEETGTIKKKKLNQDGMELSIHAKKILEDLKVNDSISCSGVCLTVTKLKDTCFFVQLVKETLNRTNAKFWEINTELNLERSLLPTTRLGGHFVQGHVDTTIKIKDIKQNNESAVWNFEMPEKIENYIVEKGSVCLDGISLTIANKFHESFSVALIPHTLEITTWKKKKIGDSINIEVDMMAKYLENLIGNKNEI
ncbi:MAG: riboflavin synthase [Candidatus Marinimicrobia bacterium]|nr:riboflavin synthase [Candidatus Neomarinimicrobiota bacterium]|tara:strand:+ start:150 stop:749 length:600 start_codon:yes stop_codon:yes gene_type:complete